MTEIYIPTEGDRDPEAETQMQMGKTESLADPWFLTEEGRIWLSQQPAYFGDQRLEGP